jgi:uncharacterized protein involved in exopolysaccharide biosynthesis
VKINEDNYLLYQRKREEARISDALDRQRILNVAIAEPPTAPVLPSHPAWLYASFGAMFALMMGSFAVFTAEYVDTSFRTPDELRTYLDVPVLAAIPESSRTRSLIRV